MRFLLAAVAVIVLSACGAEGERTDLRIDCREQRGEIIKVGSQVTCLKDGAVVAEWTEYTSQ